MILAILAIVTATARPAAPAVGDLITVEFPQAVVLDVSEEYEIVETRGKTVVVRTFEPRPFALSGTMGNVRFRNLRVPVQSVLKPKDDLKPAPLAPPVPVEAPRHPWIAIAAAAVVAAFAWALAWWRFRKPAMTIEPLLPADARFRQTVTALRNGPPRWAALADATRAYLAATHPNLGLELTTSELLRRNDDPLLATILRQGDLEKFSPWGPQPMDFGSVAGRALSLAPEKVEEAA